MKSAAGPLEPVLISIVKFIFGHADWRQSVPGSSPSGGTLGPVTGSPFLLFIQKILNWGNGLLLFLFGIGIALVLLRYLIRWLSQKRDDQSQAIALWIILSWWYRLKAFLFICYQWIFRRRAKRTAAQYYLALQRWGRYSGNSLKLDETPNEYGKRLSRQFPLLSKEFRVIIEMVHREVYGENSLDADQFHRIRHSWKKLHSPVKWPMRIKAMVTNR